MKQAASELAVNGVFIGTSSWKYEGWLDQLYTLAKYEYRGKLAQTRFERNCLTEYAEVLKTVCVDAAYYTFPSEKYLEGLVSQVPADFQFGFKVTDEITVKRFPNLQRFGMKAGKPNVHFLNADMFTTAFLKPCEKFRQNIGVLMFEFSRFYPSDYEHGRDFVAARFLLKPGRKYEEAVKSFQPYDKTKEVNDEARKAGAALIKEGKAAKKKALIFVNNRLEGSALETISAMLDQV